MATADRNHGLCEQSGDEGMKEELSNKSRDASGSHEQHSSHEILFFTDARSAVERQHPKGGKALIWITFTAVFLFVSWAAWIEIDEITRGMGKVIPSQPDSGCTEPRRRNCWGYPSQGGRHCRQGAGADDHG